MHARAQQSAARLALCLPALLILGFQIRHYLPFLSDDALISLRYAARLLSGHGLTWTDGPRVEGYSNLLWVLLVAAAGALRADLVAVARTLGAAAMAMTIVIAGLHSARGARPAHAVFPVLISSLFLACAAPIAVWAIAGLEQPLVAVLLAAASALTLAIVDAGPLRARPALALVLALLALTRPDGALFTAPAVAVILLFVKPRRDAVRAAAVVAAGPACAVAAQMIFRVLYYRAVVPNTALVKLSPSATHLQAGWDYVRGGVASMMPLSAVAIAAVPVLLAARRTRASGSYLLLALALWTAYVVAIGGDIFPAYRHLVPLVVLLAFALGEAARAAAAALAGRAAALGAVALASLALLVPYGRNQAADTQSRRAVRERWEWEGRELGLLLKDAFGHQQPLVAVTAAGAIPYWSGLPSLDMLGLNDDYLPRHPPADMGRGMIGHELGDGAYVYGREPDLIVFSIGSPPAYRSGEELDRMPAFHQRYAAVAVKLPSYPDLRLVYVNRDSAKVGIRTTATTLTVPGYFLTGAGVRAELVDGQTLAAIIPAGRTAAASLYDAGAEGWRLDHVIPASGVEARAERNGPDLILTVRNGTNGDVTVAQAVLKRTP